MQTGDGARFAARRVLELDCPFMVYPKASAGRTCEDSFLFALKLLSRTSGVVAFPVLVSVICLANHLKRVIYDSAQPCGLSLGLMWVPAAR